MPCILLFPLSNTSQILEERITPYPPPIKLACIIHSEHVDLQNLEQQVAETKKDHDICSKYSEIAIVDRRPPDNELSDLTARLSGQYLEPYGLVELWRQDYTSGKWFPIERTPEAV